MVIFITPMRLFKTKWLARFARREGILDQSLRAAIVRAEKGLVDADLGGGLIKQRVARPGSGRSGGYRMLVGFRLRDRAIFLFGFAKNERENIAANELLSLREIAARWLDANDSQIEREIELGNLEEIADDAENK